jgi:hypothetical protein
MVQDFAVLLLLRSNPDVHELRVLHPQNPIARVGGWERATQLPIYLEALREPLNVNERLPRWVDKLSTLELCLRDFTWTTITPLFSLPALKKLLINNGRETPVTHLTDAFASVAPRSSSVEALDFGTCFVTKSTVGNAISVCKALYSFKHRGLMQSDNEADHWRLSRQLFEQRNTLQTFHTCLWHRLGESFTIAKLAPEFAALSHLGLHYLAIRDNFLPPNLRSLTLYADTVDAPVIMDDLADVLPILREKAGSDIPITLR